LMTIDLRSDVLSPLDDSMWSAMRSAPTRWATFREDESVLALERRVSELLGKESAALVPTCGSANLVALMALAPRGAHVAIGTTSHIANSEGGGVSSIAGLFPRLIEDHAGELNAEAFERAILDTVQRQQGSVRVVCLENTHTNAGGRAIDRTRVTRITELARSHGVIVHLDGARLLNAAVALHQPAAELAAVATTVAMSLNKGIGAPFGAVLAGPGDVLERARLELKRIGGASVHRAGIWAAAALIALQTAENRIAEDNRRASMLADALCQLSGVRVYPIDPTLRTNIVLLEIGAPGPDADEVLRRLQRVGVAGFRHSARVVRFVTHRGIGDEDVQAVFSAVIRVLRQGD
jgi:threonine aldolase